MGLSTKQVPREDQGLGWSETLMHSSSSLSLIKPAASTRRNQQQQQLAEHLECPRCGSMNTKFCYYNNYNRSQPRHFCKACKRHWTKGGSLRNVPIGGARKNKRFKLPNNAKSATIPKSGTSGDAHIFSQISQKNGCNVLSGTALSDQKGISDTLFQALINPSSSLQNDAINSFLGKSFMVSNASSSSSILWPSQDQSMQFSLSNTNLSQITTTSQKSNAYDHQFGRIDTSLESTITSVELQPWQNPTSGAMNLSNYWSLNDMDPLVSADFHIPLSDTEIGFL